MWISFIIDIMVGNNINFVVKVDSLFLYISCLFFFDNRVENFLYIIIIEDIVLL